MKSTRNTAYDTAHMRSTRAPGQRSSALSGERIRLEREARNWSQGHTAMLAGITRMYLAKLEVGDRKMSPPPSSLAWPTLLKPPWTPSSDGAWMLCN